VNPQNEVKIGQSVKRHLLEKQADREYTKHETNQLRLLNGKSPQIPGPSAAECPNPIPKPDAASLWYHKANEYIITFDDKPACDYVVFVKIARQSEFIVLDRSIN